MKKLVLKKVVVANLSSDEMNAVEGGLMLTLPCTATLTIPIESIQRCAEPTTIAVVVPGDPNQTLDANCMIQMTIQAGCTGAAPDTQGCNLVPWP